MNILVLGSGGREHAFAYKLVESQQCDTLFVAPGNAGTANIATNVAIDPLDFQAIKVFVIDNNINLVVVGPEAPLVAGVVDYFQKDQDLQQVMIIGPSAQAAVLEGSKDFAKDFMKRHNIPTAAYQTFDQTNLEQGYAFLESLQAPYVLKADGLAAGKGVLILDDLNQAKQELSQMIQHAKFGEASNKVVIEEFLDGIELSVFVLTDGKNYITLPTAKDYKRIGEGDTGLNTGGMGAISPVPFANKEFLDKIDKQIVAPTVNGIQKDNLDYKGFIFIGLIKVDDEPKVIEYNVRMGDPETEVVLPRLQTDLVTLFEHTAKQTLDQIKLEVDKRTATTVMAVSGGYPQAYQKGKEINGVTAIDSQDAIVFHAGTKLKDQTVVTSGGRVLAVTAFGDNFQKALEKSYENIEKISFEGIYYRKDLGFDLK